MEKQFLANCGHVFGDGKQDNKDQDKLIKEIYAQIGELKGSNDWLKKKLVFQNMALLPHRYIFKRWKIVGEVAPLKVKSS